MRAFYAIGVIAYAFITIINLILQDWEPACLAGGAMFWALTAWLNDRRDR